MEANCVCLYEFMLYAALNKRGLWAQPRATVVLLWSFSVGNAIYGTPSSAAIDVW